MKKKEKLALRQAARVAALTPTKVVAPKPKAPALPQPNVLKPSKHRKRIVAKPEITVTSKPELVPTSAGGYVFPGIPQPDPAAPQVLEKRSSSPVLPSVIPTPLSSPLVVSSSKIAPTDLPHVDDLESVLSLSTAPRSPAIKPLGIGLPGVSCKDLDELERALSLLSPRVGAFRPNNVPIFLDTDGQWKQVKDTISHTHHSKYHFSDGSFNCQAENTLFCVHKHIRDLSPALAELFPTKHPFDQDPEYSSAGDRPPLRTILHGIKSVEFEALLDMIYTPVYAAKTLNRSTYLRALPLSVKWGLGDIRNFILSELEGDLSIVERYSLARDHRIHEWEESCLKSLITRPERLTVEEGHKLGIEATVIISGLREEARTHDLCLHSCTVCDSKPRLNGQSVDVAFVEGRVKEWMRDGK
ncbi:hypothetical protein BDV93DRAFT_603073 [Ceratobasidium sp. AG-I]|nr:hypothetical protein BDV93DRAFT_603073 [Ceratobasidium sp. AG-I]